MMSAQQNACDVFCLRKFQEECLKNKRFCKEAKRVRKAMAAAQLEAVEKFYELGDGLPPMPAQNDYITELQNAAEK